MSKLNPEAPAFVPSSSSAGPEPSSASVSPAQITADACRRDGSIAANQRLLEYAELCSFGRPGGSPLKLLTWAEVVEMGGPELTTGFEYWGLAAGSKKQRNARYSRLCLDEMEWIFSLPEAALREAIDYVAVRGWVLSARSMAMTLGLRDYRLPRMFQVVSGSSGPGLPRIEWMPAGSIEELVGSMAGLQINPIREDLVQGKPKACHRRAAKQLLDTVENLAASRRRTLEVIIFVGVHELMGFDVDWRRRRSSNEAEVLDMLAAASAAGGSVCVVDQVQGCAFHAGSPATAAGIFAFEASNGALLALSPEEKEKIWKFMDSAYHTHIPPLPFS
ncbi:hypothetical protein DFJ74DRAFT_641067 [Hyaloraphidium curvatum]|nr:hypothetical protein DFJ74DRAFT_641067 [Hyaloraphidium curvatum]